MKAEDRYKFGARLGAGAFGTIYDAFDTKLPRHVAIKVMRLPSDDDTETEAAYARMQQEIQAAGRLNHPNIVAVYDFIETDREAWIIMERIEGGSLKDLLDRDRQCLALRVDDPPGTRLFVEAVGSDHPVQRFVRASIGVDRQASVGFDHEQAGRHGEVCGEAAVVVDRTPGDDETHAARLCASVSDATDSHSSTPPHRPRPPASPPPCRTLTTEPPIRVAQSTQTSTPSTPCRLSH